MELLKAIWSTIKETIQKEYGLSLISYNTWIAPLELADVVGNTVYIKIPSDNQQALNYIQNKFKDFFQVTISEMMDEEYQIEFILNKEETPSEEPVISSPITNKVAYENTNLNPKYTFDTLVVGGYNKLAHSAAQAVAEDPGHAYNPLFLYGGPGLGKTHLIQSIGHKILQKDPNAHILYVTSEEFTNEVIESIRSGNAAAMTKLREKYRTVDVLMVDDVQFIIGKESTQEEFFHTFNVLHSTEKQIILTSDRPPKEMETLEERFRSRFGWGIIADINAPDYETRAAILLKKCENLNKKIDDSIIQYIANNIKSNIRELEGALNKILAFSKLNNIPITLSMAEEALKDMISPHKEKEITPELILQIVCEHYSINEQAVLSSKKTKDISMVRQIIMYLCREYINDMSLKNIAEFLGKKDHTTIMHGISKVEYDIDHDYKFKNNLDIIKKKLLL
ncbi:MAG: chromosomal replication initiator protein DnaA [Lachnospiraceae bacterium]|nr:chromosomal replication initiator protein DnaA [Lachnospiraceae bacterium]